MYIKSNNVLKSLIRPVIKVNAVFSYLLKYSELMDIFTKRNILNTRHGSCENASTSGPSKTSEQDTKSAITTNIDIQRTLAGSWVPWTEGGRMARERSDERVMLSDMGIKDK